MAHLGRPKGEPEPAYSLARWPPASASCSARRCTSRPTRWGSRRGRSSPALADGEVALLENVRFNAGETSKDEAERGEFADQLAALGDAFVSDGFGVVHRKQASVYDVAQRLPHTMGGLVRTEIEVLRKLTEDPERPYVVVLGGSKVSDKLAVIDNLLGKADKLLIGGGMVFTFLASNIVPWFSSRLPRRAHRQYIRHNVHMRQRYRSNFDTVPVGHATGTLLPVDREALNFLAPPYSPPFTIHLSTLPGRSWIFSPWTPQARAPLL